MKISKKVVAIIFIFLILLSTIIFLESGKTKIVDAETDAPIEGATIFVRYSYCFFDSCGLEQKFVKKTDKNGKFEPLSASLRLKEIRNLLINFNFLGGYVSGHFFIFKEGYIPKFEGGQQNKILINSYSSTEELLAEERFRGLLELELRALTFNQSSKFCPSDDENLKEYCSFVQRIGLSLDECSKILLSKNACAYDLAQIRDDPTICLHAPIPRICLKDLAQNGNKGACSYLDKEEERNDCLSLYNQYNLN